MVITYHGDNYFKIQSGSLTVLIDPTNQRSFRGANLVLNTVRPSQVLSPGDENVFWVDHQGEYETAGIRVFGKTVAYEEGKNAKEHTIYKVEIEGMSIAVLGYITGEPEPEVAPHLNAVDILITPASGKPLIPLKDLARFVRQVEPTLVIPSLYKKLDPFLKEFGEDKCKMEDKLVLKKKDVKSGEMKIVCLKKV